ncbi:MAG: hypothetical protein MJZ31_12680 [Bacteroidales bacterium]|nr:hypothetical protein [Bacteroidales bacterium]
MKKAFTLLSATLIASSAWAQNVENGHEYVDLGLTSGTMWATTNIGADTPEAIGNYFAWGETATKETYNWETYTLCDGDYDQLTKYIPAGWNAYGKDDVTDDKSVLEKADDVASQTWQGNWAIPTPDQLNELVTKCCWLYTNTYKGNSVAGYIIYKAKNESDKGAFYVYQLPPTGYTTEDTHIFLPVNCGDFCHYWSNTVAENNPAMAVAFSFVSNDIPKIKQEVRNGSTKVSVRPVFTVEKTQTATKGINADFQKTIKTIENGRVVIKKGDKTFDLSGKEL